MPINYKVKIVTTTPYTIANDDEIVMINVSGPASVILPTSSSSEGNGSDKRSLYIKDYSGNARTNPITITSANGKLIDGHPFAMLGRGYSHIQVVYDGTNWMTIA